MEKYPPTASEIFSSAKYDETDSRDDQEDQRIYFESHRVSTDTNCWWVRDGEKPDPRQRWSFGSDISVEADETIQNRLCCSPADEFDSTISSENEDLIVNCTDEANRSHGTYPGISLVSPPSFKEVDDVCSDNQDVDTADDELIDYSKRYTTDSLLGSAQNKGVTQSHPQKSESIARAVTRPVARKNSVTNRSKLDSYRDYAETDLDQPTDYSLRYAEEGFDGEKRNNTHLCTNGAEDYLRTYYTEGTPYQTPSNFSAATSVSDLSSLDGVRGETEEDHQLELLKKDKSSRLVEQKFAKGNKDQTIHNCAMKQPKSVLTQAIRDTRSQKCCEKNSKKLSSLPPPVKYEKEREIKPVAYFQNESSAQETPLMYSRSSSLDSLSDFEQNLFNDDGSSVISDFSHRTSGAVSPSELPDSPTQLVPPSPAKYKQQLCEPHNRNFQKRSVREPMQKTPTHLHLQNVGNRDQDESDSRAMPAMKPTSIFEDGLLSFKEESIPVKSHSSRASVLSALTIDDELGNNNGFDDQEIMCRISALKNKTATVNLYQTDESVKNYKQSVGKSEEPFQHKKTSSSFQGLENNSSTTNGRISSKINDEYGGSNGMLMNKQATQYTPRDPRDDPISDSDKIKILNQYQTKSRPKQGPFLKSNSISTTPSSQKVNPEDQMKICDSTRIYCTENTPTYISPSGSFSNLSALSIISGPEENFSFEQFRLPREQERFASREGSYCSEEEKPNSDICEDNYEDGAYEIEEESEHRIDVSPFDSQTNLAQFTLLSIEEENEEEEEELEAKTNKKIVNYKTDNVAPVSEERIYDRFSQSDNDYVDEEAVLEECIKTGATRFARQNFHLKNR